MPRAFHGLLTVTLLSEETNQWWIREELTFESADGSTHTIPVGTVINFASVPRAPVLFFVAGDRARMAAALHDYLYSIGFDRKKADDYFLEAMEETGIPWAVRRAMYRAVRLFGARFHNSNPAKANP